MSLKTSLFAIALAATAASLPLVSTASAQPRFTSPTDLSCRYVGAVSHRCYYFQSDATWREGLSSYHGSNGG
jgi:hypothetical protein